MYNRFFQQIESNQKKIVIAFFSLFFIISITVLKDYGLSWDEKTQWKANGEIAVAYMINPGQNREMLLRSTEKYHGPAFEIVLVVCEKILHLKDTRAVYLMRHVLTFLTFFVAVICFYFLCKRCLKNWKLALIGCIFLVLSPRIFADSFYNSKDLPFLSFFIFGMYFLLLFHEQPTYKNAIIYGIVSAFAIDIRIMGILLPVTSLFFFVTDVLYAFLYNKKERLYVKQFILFNVCLVLFIIAFWPVLWEGPIHHFSEGFKEMRKFPWTGAVLFRGDTIYATNLPWNYLPVWIAITTPVPYLLLFLIGILFISYTSLCAPLNLIFYKKEQQLLLICSILTLTVVIIFKSVVYDGWRHVFFIYPSVIIILLYGLIVLYKWSRKKKELMMLGLSLLIGYNLVTMMRLHPHEYVYFNIFAGKNMNEVKKNFELDYFGVSSKEALEFILKNDTSAVISMYPEHYPQEINIDFLPKEQRDRIKLTAFKDATYFIAQPRSGKDYNFEKEVFSVFVGNASIMSVFELTENDKMKNKQL
jgi:hypothetical protein